jgi:hypothetical protein
MKFRTLYVVSALAASILTMPASSEAIDPSLRDHSECSGY